jgi:hypothetical protein
MYQVRLAGCKNPLVFPKIFRKARGFFMFSKSQAFELADIFQIEMKSAIGHCTEDSEWIDLLFEAVDDRPVH